MTLTLEAPSDAVPMFHELGVEDLAGESPAIDWLLEGYVAPGAVTLLTGGWKAAGKTTLVAALIKRLQTGGQLAGLTVRPGKVLVVSEEEKLHWRL
jgi:RecA-family ATPase